MSLFDLVKSELERFGVTKDDRILVGLSGGSDSVCLLHCLHNAVKERLVALHVNHGIRGAEADGDEQFCIKLCERFGIPLVRKAFDIPSLAEDEKTGLEECARKYRYDAFLSYARENGIKFVATAHNANDNAENVIFNLCRGSGIKGLCGIPHIREQDGVFIIRPIIKAEKPMILDHLAQNGLSYVSDATNDSTDYTRNYIRHEVLPRLARINQNYIENISNCGDILLKCDDHIKSCADAFIARQRRNTLDCKELLRLDGAVAFRAISIFLGENSSYKMVNIVYELAKNAENGSSLDVSHNSVITVSDGMLMLLPRVNHNGYELPLCEGVNNFRDLGFTLYLFYNKIPDGENIYKSLKRTIIDGDKINGKLYIRSRRENDRFFFGGMTRMPKKMLAAKRVPHHLRANYPILCDDGGSICMPGFPTNDGYDGRSSKNKMIILYRGEEA